MGSKKQRVITMAVLLYLSKSIITKVAPTKEETSEQVDKLIFNKLIKQIEK